MKILIIHQIGQKIHYIKQGFQYQNIQTATFVFQEKDEIVTPLSDFNAVVFYIRNSAIDTSFINFIKTLRQQYPTTPFIIFDESNEAELKSVMLQCGADAHFCKPFVFSEIANEIKRIVYRKSKLNGSKILKFADLQLHLYNRVAKRRSKTIYLRNKEFALLEFLLINKEKVLTRDMIIDYVWDRNQRLLSNTIDVHIGLLRRKIDADNKNKLIHTMHCVGYRLGKPE